MSAASMKLLSSLNPERKLEPARKAEVHENKAFSKLSNAFMELLECKGREWPRSSRIAHEKLKGITFRQKDVELAIPFMLNLSHEPDFEKASSPFITALISHPCAEGLALDLSRLPKGIVPLRLECRKSVKNVSILLPEGACSTIKIYRGYLDEWDILHDRYEILLISPRKDPSYSSIRMLTNCPRVRMHEGKIEYDEMGMHFDRWEG